MLTYLSLSGRYVFVPDRPCNFSRSQTRSRVFEYKNLQRNRFVTKGRKPVTLPPVRAESASTGKNKGGDSNEDKGPLQGLQNWWKRLTGAEGTASIKHTWMSLNNARSVHARGAVHKQCLKSLDQAPYYKGLTFSNMYDRTAMPT